MLWLAIVAICREVFFTGYIIQNVTAVYKFKRFNLNKRFKICFKI